MKTIKQNPLILVFLIFLAAVILTACNPLTPVEFSRVTIDTGLTLGSAGSRALQTDVDSFRLTVTASDMTTIEREFTDAVINLEIAAGSARTFTLQALDTDGNVLFSGNKTVDLTAGQEADIVIDLGYAGFYVTFVTSGGSALPVQYVQSGGLVSVSSPPVKTDYILEGWYTDSDFSIPWNLASDTISSDLTLYANWVEAMPPVPGSSGVLTFSSVTDTTITVSWNAATDDTTAQASLLYDVYRSESNNITSLADLSDGTKLTGSSQPNITSYSDSGLSAETTYYYNVVVTDEAGNQAVYTTGSQVTEATIIANLFSDDFSTDGALDGSTPDVGGVWAESTSSLNVVGGVVDTSLAGTGTSLFAFADFTAPLAAGETLFMVFKAENLSSGTFSNSSWAGISLFTSGSTGIEQFFIGNIGSLSGWGISGSQPVDALLSPPVTAAAQTAIFTYEYDTGVWTLEVGGSTDTGTVSAGLALDCVRIGAESMSFPQDGDIAVSSIKIGAESEPFAVNQSIGSVNSSYPSFAVADLDGNGLVDAVAYLNASSTGIRTYIQNPVGTFTETQSLSTEVLGAAKSVYGTALGDLDNDGYPDFITAGPNGASDSFNAVFRNSSGTFETSGTTTYMSNTSAFYGNRAGAADIDGDSYDDVVWFGGNSFYVGLSDNAGGFSSIQTVSGGFSGSVYGYDIADVDNNGNVDVIHSRAYNGDGNGAIELFEGDGSGGFTQYATIDQAVYSSDFPVYLNPFAVKIMDLDNDGENDILFHNKSTDGTYGLWKGIRTSAQGVSPVYLFEEIATTQLNSNLCWFIDEADWNGDGYMDFVTSSNGGVQLYTNDGSGNFDETSIVTTSCWQAFFRDMDSDGMLDIVGNIAGTIRVYYQ